MIDIRPIRPPEAESFLELLCGVFDLDIGRARSIFFSEPLFDLNRKWALFDGSQILSILTTVPLEFGWGRAIGIAGVATDVNHQREGLAAQLLETVLEESSRGGEVGAMLFAKDTRLYERTGFKVLDEVVRGPLVYEPETDIPSGYEFDTIRSIYDKWAEADDNRLRRNDLRWKYWKWNLRVCTPFHDGYLCFEGGMIREVVVNSPATEWILPIDTEWLGLKSMAEGLGAQLGPTDTDLMLMGRGIPDMPQFFMTDQF